MSGFPSPNHGERRGAVQPSFVVIHYTAMGSCHAARERLCDPAAEVSAHWLLSADGRAEQLVDEARRAWHAGAGAWRGVTDVNSHSIGIELANSGREPFSEPQMARLEELLGAMFARWPIVPEGVIGHSDMAPDRKADPGPRFDWRRLARQGLAVWPQRVAGGDPAQFFQDARRFGYPQVEEALVLRAFRMRFRPWAEGPVDAVDAAMIADLARRFPVDPDGRGA